MAYVSKNAGPANSHYIPRGATGEKRCSQCLTYKPLDRFDIDRSRYDGRAYVCKDCKRGTKIVGPSRAERREKLALGLRWCRRCNDWTAKRAGLCRAHANEEMRQRYASDEAFRRRRQMRHAARRLGVSAIPIEAQESILHMFDGRCVYCGADAEAWDHFVAIKNGGVTEPGNIVPACRSCNSSKRDANAWEWMERTGRVPHEMLECRLLLHNVHHSVSPDPFD